MAKQSQKLEKVSGNQKAAQAPVHRRWPVKISVVGDLYVGKTSVINRFVHDRFDEHVSATIAGIAYNISTTYIDCNFDWHIWDISGCLSFRTMIPNYFRGCEVFIVMFDITRRESFENVPEWMNQIQKAVPTEAEKLVFIICGNKQDLTEDREISEAEAKSLAKELKASYFETSAKLGSGISEMFRTIARRMRTIKMKTTQPVEDFHAVSLRNPQSRPTNSNSKCC